MLKITRRLKVWIGLASSGVLTALAIMLGVILSRHRNEYPDYHPLKYKLMETCEYHHDLSKLEARYMMFLDTGSDFFNKFDFFTGNDPSNGHVIYVNTSTSNALNLTYATSSSAFLRVDTSESRPLGAECRYV
ncbi:hypothetical protein BDV29DRAFT_163326 [Aspergillus leporis]|uniref:Uncharacterized protein n=1 Tax=Aspergillus leporis TaxID=41062 RepID=A0A5N5WJL0_9EURO|nr:hypothetical protein BDV29DRAFT_163326 [Aspergillus leporis]